VEMVRRAAFVVKPYPVLPCLPDLQWST